MGTTTLGITYPDPTSNVNLWTHLQTLATAVDTLMAGRVKVCTSSTRPSTATTRYTGVIIFETDTKLEYIWDGTTWVLLGNHTVSGQTVAKVTKTGSTTVTLNASGEADIVTGFTTMDMFVAWNGDGGARANMVIGNVGRSIVWPASGTNVRVKAWLGNTGAIIPSVTARIDWIAVGNA